MTKGEVTKDRQYHGQRVSDKRQTISWPQVKWQKTDNIMATGEVTKGQTVMYKSLHRKLKFEQCELYKDQGVNSGAPGGAEYEISVQLVIFLVFL